LKAGPLGAHIGRLRGAARVGAPGQPGRLRERPWRLERVGAERDEVEIAVKPLRHCSSRVHELDPGIKVYAAQKRWRARPTVAGTHPTTESSRDSVRTAWFWWAISGPTNARPCESARTPSLSNAFVGDARHVLRRARASRHHLQDGVHPRGASLWDATSGCERLPRRLQPGRGQECEREVAVSGVIELVAIECCGERYVLVEELRSSLVARWFVRDGCESGQPVTACLGCRGPFEAPQPRESARVLWGTGAPRSPT
jgi:hypothetical protein